MIRKNFIAGVILGVALTGTSVLATEGVTALLTLQNFTLNGQEIRLEAYNINGMNYIKLRDAASLFCVPIEYDEYENMVYLGERPNRTPILENTREIDGKDVSREDFSQKANQSIFDDDYTRAMYNTLYQTINDTEKIVSGNDEYGYNKEYSYAHFVDKTFSLNGDGKTINAAKEALSAINGYYWYNLSVEPDVMGLYNFPGYRMCSVEIDKNYNEANKATEKFIEQVKTLKDKDKFEKIADYIADKMQYNENVSSLNEIFTKGGNGMCGTYAQALNYLCSRCDIPSVIVTDAEYGWNEVYIDGKWQTADMGLYDTAKTSDKRLISKYNRSDQNPKRTNFAKELLVPNSTK